VFGLTPFSADDPVFCGPILLAPNLCDSPEGWSDYVQQLQMLALNAAEQERRGFGEMCRGWAIGTAGWRKALAKTYSQHGSTARARPKRATRFKGGSLE
jgi:hypothetical protein